MPKFFFDCFDGTGHLVDDYGISLETESEIRDHAIMVAQTLFTEALPSEDTKVVAVTVRAADGSPTYTTHCSFTARWTKDQGSIVT